MTYDRRPELSEQTPIFKHLKELTENNFLKKPWWSQAANFLFKRGWFFTRLCCTLALNWARLICRRVTVKHSPPIQPKLPWLPSSQLTRVRIKRTKRCYWGRAGGGSGTGLLFLMEATEREDRHFSFAPPASFQSLVNTTAAPSAFPHLGSHLYSLPCDWADQPQTQEQSQEPEAKIPKKAGLGDISHQPGIFARIWLFSVFPKTSVRVLLVFLWPQLF